MEALVTNMMNSCEQSAEDVKKSQMALLREIESLESGNYNNNYER